MGAGLGLALELQPPLGSPGAGTSRQQEPGSRADTLTASARCLGSPLPRGGIPGEQGLSGARRWELEQWNKTIKTQYLSSGTNWIQLPHLKFMM